MFSLKVGEPTHPLGKWIPKGLEEDQLVILFDMRRARRCGTGNANCLAWYGQWRALGPPRSVPGWPISDQAGGPYNRLELGGQLLDGQRRRATRVAGGLVGWGAAHVHMRGE